MPQRVREPLGDLRGRDGLVRLAVAEDRLVPVGVFLRGARALHVARVCLLSRVNTDFFERGLDLGVPQACSASS